MGKEQIISKGKYSYAQPDDMVGVKQYLFVKEEDGKKRLLLRFCNNRQEKCSKFAFILYRLDAKGNILGQDKFESADREYGEKEVFSFDRKIAVEDKCTDFKVQMVYARYGNYTYNVEHNDVSVAYSEKNASTLNHARSATKIKPRKMHERTFDMPWIFAVLSMVILALVFAACSFLLKNYKETKIDFTLSGVHYQFDDRDKSDDVIIVGCSDKDREITLNDMVDGKHKVVGIDGDAFVGNQNIISIKVNGLDIPKGAFQGCTKLESVKLTGVSSIGESAFEDCKTLKKVEIVESEPGQLISIGAGAFGDCGSLKTVEINQTIVYGNKVDFFTGSKNIETLKLKNFAFTMKDVNSNYVTRIASLFGENNKNKSSVNLVNLTISNMDAVPESFVRGFKLLKNVTIGGGEIKTVGGHAFEGCEALTTFKANGQLLSIGDYAFSGTDIASLDMSKVSSLGEGVFKNNDKLTTVSGFGAGGIDNIPRSTFEGCKALTEFAFHKNIKHVFGAAFADSGLVKLNIPVGVSYDDGILKGCDYLKELEVYEFGSAGFVGQLFGADRNDKSNVVAGYISKNLTKITLGTGKNINADAFKGCSNVTTIKLPQEIEIIGENAFSGCAKLTSIDIPKESTFLKRIEKEAFSGCAELKYVPFLETLEYIGEDALLGCNKIETLELPFFGATKGQDEDETISYIFGTVPASLKEIYLLDASVTSLPNEAFKGCSGVKTIIIPNGVTSIGNYAFYGCSELTSVGLSDGSSGGKLTADLSKVINIGDYAFDKCEALSSVTFGADVSIIGKYAFANSGLKTVIIPESVDFIDAAAFKGCDGMGTMTVPYLGATSSENGKLSYFFDGQVPESLKAVKVLSFKDKIIGDEAFKGCGSIVSLELPNDISAVSEEAFMNCSSLATFNFAPVLTVGDRAFKGCSSLKGVDLKNVEIIGNEAFCGCSALTKAELTKAGIIDDSAFYNCVALADVTLSDGLVQLGSNAFGKTAIKSIVIPNGITVIDDYTFGGCEKLEKVTLPSYLISIGDGAFSDTALTEIKIPSSVTRIDGFAFKNTKLNSLVIPRGVTEIGYNILSGCNTLTEIEFPMTNEMSDYNVGAYLFGNSFPTNLKNVTLNGSTNGVIHNNAFAYANGIEEVIINADIRYIKWEAFTGCTELRYVSLPTTLESVDGSAFAMCYRLYEISNPSTCSVSTEYTIGYTSSFADRAPTIEKDGYKIAEYNGEWYLINCPKEEEIKTPDGFIYGGVAVEEYSVPSYLFFQNNAITKVTLSPSVVAVGANAFDACGGLVSIVLSDNIESIGAYAFYNCGSLKSAQFPKSLVSIGDAAFYECNNLNDVKLYEKVRYIGTDAFYGCSNLYDVYNASSLNLVAGSKDYGYIARRAVKVHTDMKEALSSEVQVNGLGVFRNSGNAWLLIKGYDVADLKLENFKYNDVTVKSYRIAEGAFENKYDIKNITIGNAVKQIQQNAFNGCGMLESLDCSKNTSLTEIENGTFSWCTSLERAILPVNVKAIGNSAFEGCTLLNEVSMPTALVTIGDGAFRNCLRLISITLNDKVQSIGSDAFDGCEYLLEVYDLSPYISVSRGDYSNGYVGYYASAVYTNTSSKLERKEQDGMKFIFGHSTWYLYDYENSNQEIITIRNHGNKLVIMPYSFMHGTFDGIVLPTNLYAIKSGAFNGNTSLNYLYYMGNSDDWYNVNGAYDATNYYQVYYKADCVHYNSYNAWTYKDGKVSTQMCPETSKITKPSTCYETGTVTYYCDCENCDYTRTETKEREDHEFVNDVCKKCNETRTSINGTTVKSYVDNEVIIIDGFKYDESKKCFKSENEQRYTNSFFTIEADKRMTVTFTLEASCVAYSDYIVVYKDGVRGSSVTGTDKRDFEIRLEKGDVLMICFEKGDYATQDGDCGYIKNLCIVEMKEQQSN